MAPELAALAVHDLKNALGTLETLLQGLEAAPSPAAARAAREHCEQLRRETVAFLTLYRGEGLRAMVDDESPRSLLESLLPRTASAVPAIAVEAARAPPFWYLDARLVRLALDAGLHNARRFARSRVLLSAAEVDGWLVFTIDDDGPGLAATADAPGAWSTGLGTELCTAVAQAHHNGARRGRVELADGPLGGARFSLFLP